LPNCWRASDPSFKTQAQIDTVHGKQKRVKRPPAIDGMSVEEFIRNNADPLWYHQNEMW